MKWRGGAELGGVECSAQSVLSLGVVSRARLSFIVWGWKKRVWYNLIERLVTTITKSLHNIH